MKRLLLSVMLCSGACWAQPTASAYAPAPSIWSQSMEVMTGVSRKWVDQANDLISDAMGYLGTPYRKGGTTDKGFDCSGFVQTVYANTLGLILPRSALEQAKATDPIEATELQPGDLVFFNTMRRAYSHVGIYLGNDQFIHSPRPGKQVRVENMSDSYWAKRFNGARRVHSDSADPRPQRP